MELRFEKTCDACPEQWEVYDGDKIVGYIRLRFSNLTVQCPDVGGECIYEAKIGNSGYDGCFDNEAERAFHLDEAKVAIEKWLKENE